MALGPTVAEFEAALRHLGEDLNDVEWSILNAQAARTAHGLTAAACAELAGGSSYRYGNRVYGGLGQKFYEALGAPGWTLSRSDGSIKFWSVIATGADCSGEFVWKMRLELVEALARR